MRPLVSVIIPIFNSTKYVAEAIDSVLAQTYKNYEIIVVDDGSKDNPLSVLQKYVSQGQISYVWQAHGGVAAARNNGIGHATGEFVALLDADDLWLPNKLELQIALFQDADVALVYTNDEHFYENGSIECNPNFRYFKKGYIFKDLLCRNFIGASTVILRKSCLQKTGFFPEACNGADDYHLWLRISYYYKVYYVKDVLVKYRKHRNNASLDVLKLSQGRIQVIVNITSLFHIPLRQRYLHRTYMLLCDISLGNNSLSKSFGYFFKVVLSGPLDINTYKLLFKIIWHFSINIFKRLVRSNVTPNI